MSVPSQKVLPYFALPRTAFETFLMSCCSRSSPPGIRTHLLSQESASRPSRTQWLTCSSPEWRQPPALCSTSFSRFCTIRKSKKRFIKKLIRLVFSQKQNLYIWLTYIKSKLYLNSMLQKLVILYLHQLKMSYVILQARGMYRPVWPEKNRQMSIIVAQKWFHKKNDRFWLLFKNCQRMWEIWAK